MRDDNDIIPAEVFPPGEYIRDELEARGWEQRDLAAIMDRPERTISEIITGKRAVTAETARQLSAAFGTSAELWLNLEASYRLGLLRQTDGAIERRARLYSVAPIKDMLRRGWLLPSSSIEVLEIQVMEFYGIKSLDETPSICSTAVARKVEMETTFSTAQCAWLCRARNLARTLKVARFSAKRLTAGLNALTRLAGRAEDARKVPAALAELGIRFVVVEHLPGTKIDGACFWLDASSPVVALSMRYDRIDGFWFTLMHEIGHVSAEDGRDKPIPPDIDLAATAQTSRIEKAANAFAEKHLLPRAALTAFIARSRPNFTAKVIETFAAEQGVHPGIVVGQLQFAKEIAYATHRGSLAKVRELLLETALYDGWGVTPRE